MDRLDTAETAQQRRNISGNGYETAKKGSQPEAHEPVSIDGKSSERSQRPSTKSLLMLPPMVGVRPVRCPGVGACSQRDHRRPCRPQRRQSRLLKQRDGRLSLLVSNRVSNVHPTADRSTDRNATCITTAVTLAERVDGHHTASE